MNKKSSILKLAGILLVAGLALYFVSIAAFASDAPVLGFKGTELIYEKEDYTTNAAEINQILIRARNMPIKVTPSKDNEITIHYYTCENDPYEVSLDGGKTNASI